MHDVISALCGKMDMRSWTLQNVGPQIEGINKNVTRLLGDGFACPARPSPISPGVVVGKRASLEHKYSGRTLRNAS